MDTWLPTTWTFPPTHILVKDTVINENTNTDIKTNTNTNTNTKRHKAANNLDFSTHPHSHF